MCVVTGGSGFLGQHIVHLLQTKCDDVREVRTFDIQPVKKFLGMYTEEILMQTNSLNVLIDFKLFFFFIHIHIHIGTVCG